MPALAAALAGAGTSTGRGPSGNFGTDVTAMPTARRMAIQGSLLAAAAVAFAAVGGVSLASTDGPAALAGSGSPPPLQSSLSDVSCPAAKLCLAVGASQPLSGLNSPFSQIWDGATWRTLATPERQPDSYLVGVSCASPTRCLAVGNDQHTGVPFGDHWNGKAWRTLPAFKLPTHATLNGVSCPAAGTCITVGTGRTAFSARGALAESWNGTAWTRLATAGPPGATSSSFAGISCASVTNCLAVGQYFTGTGNNQVAHALAESWNGSAWTSQTVPSGPDGLAGVSCTAGGSGGPSPQASTAVTTCMVVGGGLFAATWNGSAWTTLSVANPGNPFPGLLAVSCASATSCMTLGGDLDTGMYAQSWTGGPSLTLLSIPNPAQAPRGLSALSCPGPSTCLAVGSIASLGNPQEIPLVESWNGASWQARRTERVDGLASVSCPAASSCLAVGNYLSKADNNQAMAQTWGRASLRLASPPGLLGDLSDVSCASPSFCMAAGAKFSGFAVESWQAGHWKRQASRSALAGISCVSRAFCMAVAGRTVAGPDGLASATWNGTAWHKAAPFATAGTTTAIAGLSCTSAKYCMAVGSYTTDQHGEVNVPLAETWNGTRWKQLHAPAPGPNAAFGAVSCVAGSGCVAVGNYDDIKNVGHNMAARWNGSSWRVFKLPGGSGYGGGPINGLSGPTSVSCPSLDSCMAVGSFYDAGTGIVHDLAISWNGTSWRLTTPARPGGGLADVSCPRPDRCLAVGQVGTRTLAELWNGATWSLLRPANPN